MLHQLKRKSTVAVTQSECSTNRPRPRCVISVSFQPLLLCCKSGGLNKDGLINLLTIWQGNERLGILIYLYGSWIDMNIYAFWTFRALMLPSILIISKPPQKIGPNSHPSRRKLALVFYQDIWDPTWKLISQIGSSFSKENGKLAWNVPIHWQCV